MFDDYFYLMGWITVMLHNIEVANVKKNKNILLHIRVLKTRFGVK